MKTYVVKTYNVNWSYKETINPDRILNEIDFSNTLNWGQWQLSLQTDYPFSDTSYKGWEYVKVWLYDENHIDWKQIYYWYISKIQRKAEQSREYTTFTCLWVWSLLKSILYTNGNYSQTCYNMMNTIRSFFNGYYANVITNWTIYSGWNTQAWTWKYNNCFDCFQTIANVIGYNWTVDSLGKLDLFIPNTRTKHTVHMSEEVVSITVDNSIEEMCNYLALERTGASSTYQDATSQSTYKMKMKYEMNTNLNSATTMNDYWNSYIANYKNPKQSIQIVLNSEYPYEDIKPWDIITVLNTELTTLKNLVINKIQYKTDQAILIIDYEDTLWKVIK